MKEPHLPLGWYVNFYSRDFPREIIHAVGPYPTKEDADVFERQSLADRLVYDLRVEKR